MPTEKILNEEFLVEGKEETLDTIYAKYGEDAYFECLEQLVEMANFRPSETGLPMVCWIRPDAKVKHQLPYLKVNQILGNKVSDLCCSLSISGEPEILIGEWLLGSKNLRAVKNFIVHHKDTLLAAWKHEISISELKQKISEKLDTHLQSVLQ